MRERGSGRGRFVQREPVLLVDENVFDGAIAVGPQLRRPRARGVEAVGPMDAPQAHQAEAGAVALLRMGAVLKDVGDESSGGPSRLGRPGDQARGGPLGVRAMRSRHMSDLRREAAATGQADVRGDAPPVGEDFDRAGGEARLDPRVYQLVGDAVEIVVHLHVVVHVDADRLPLRELVPRARQRHQRGPIELLEEGPPADAR